ncbi:YihY family inner membrane protein [Neisseria sp. WLZKY-1]|uniref:YihY family inner membrane protein n=1 Tax=Neisseria sp. WLZKY-1 TaxID=3390377 RepID=UPI00397D5C93
MRKTFSWHTVRESRAFSFAAFLYRRFDEVDVPQVSASLTFTSLLALVPVLTVVLSILSAFPMYDRLSASVLGFIDGNLVPQGAGVVREYLARFQSNAANLTAIGIAFLVVTSVLLIRTIDQTFNRIWQVKNLRPLWMQFLVYWMLLTFAPLTVGAAFSVWELLLSHSSLAALPAWLSDGLKTAGSLALDTAALWLLYHLVPNRYVPARHALIGAALTAVLLDLLRRGFAWYIGTFNSYTLIYGAFAAVPVFLMWLNLLWMLLLGGAVFTSSLSYWQGDAFRRSFGARGRFDDVLKILLLLNRAQSSGQTLRIQDFRRHIDMGYDELGDLLDKLARYGYIYHGNLGWVLKTTAANIRLEELFQLFVYRPAADPGDSVGQAVSQIMTPGLESMNLSLEAFDRRTRPPQEAV